VTQFEIGSWYRNRKWRFQVLEIQGDEMRVRTEAGVEKSVSLSQQAKFIETIQRDCENALLDDL
jgi:hypothetical protein